MNDGIKSENVVMGYFKAISEKDRVKPRTTSSG
jgi:hypothetical protein